MKQTFGQGSVDEDHPSLRVLAHFHDPTKSWPSAGLTILGIPVGESSILWQQRTNQGPFASYSWFDARDAYFRALTETERNDRDHQWANTFRTVGHLVHLIQDAAAPAHTRNDAHFVGDGFHVWADSAPALDLVDTGPLTLPDASLLTLPSDLDAPVAIAHLIDADSGARPTPEWGLDIGIAEYSNAKFFSDDRLFSAYPDPAEASLESCPDSCTSAETCHKYLCFKANEGETDYKVAHVSALADFLSPGSMPAEPPLDAVVFQGYGQKLFPRAIGYSVALLDYFFRGRFDFEPDPATPGTYLIRNRSGERMTGTFTLYVDDGDGRRRLVPGKQWSTGAGGLDADAHMSAAFSLVTDLPVDAVAYIVLFDGRIGDEADAVAAISVPMGGPVLVNPAGRLRYDTTGWHFTPDPGLEFGNVDWYGAAGAVSWIGPRGRYFEPDCNNPYPSLSSLNRPVDALSTVIYEKGAARYDAPAPVLGAALQAVTGANGPERLLITLVAVPSPSYPGFITGVRAYRADTQASPLSWEAGPTLDFGAETNALGHPFYFNASGTKAQAVWPAYDNDFNLVLQQIRFTWGGGFQEGFQVTTLGLQVEYPNGNPTPEAGTELFNTFAVDYRGDDPVVGHVQQLLEYTRDDASCTVISSETGALTVNGSNAIPVVAFTSTYNCYSYPLTDAVSMDALYLTHLDLRPASPVLVGHRVSLDGVYLNQMYPHVVAPAWRVSGAEQLLAPVQVFESQGGFPRFLALPFCAETMSTTTDPDGNAAVAWSDWAAAVLSPDADLLALTGAAGPVGLY